MIKRLLSIFLIILLCGLVAGCSGGFSNLSPNNPPESGGDFALEYATQFSVETFDEGHYAIRINDGLNYYVLPKEAEVPDWVNGDSKSNYTIIRTPINSLYLAASSAMDFMSVIESLDKVPMTATKAADWDSPLIKNKVESGEIAYVGKYSAPDYEAILYNDCDLAIESTMIYHSPEVKEALEDLGIPVMVERSSYESHPLGRMERIKLYGIIFGQEELANQFFDDESESFKRILSETESIPEDKRPEVGFFSISTNNYATVRKPGDYISQLIYMAGGKYAMADLPVQDENALSTTNIQLESLYDYVVDSDILIYNSAIQGEITGIDELIDKFGELSGCKAVKDGNVWCADKSLYQGSAGIGGVLNELNLIINGDYDEVELEWTYFRKLS